jgi:hypothetical protein
MKVFGKVVHLFLVMFVASLMMFGQTQAAESCHKINAKGEGQDLGGGHTVATLKGGGLLNGSTEGQFSTAGSPPALDIAGTVKFTTKQATLTVYGAGKIDGSTGEFYASGPVIAATGKLEGATGTLTFQGVENLSTGSFVETITGQICVDLAP